MARLDSTVSNDGFWKTEGSVPINEMRSSLDLRELSALGKKGLLSSVTISMGSHSGGGEVKLHGFSIEPYSAI